LQQRLRHREEEFSRLIRITERINYGVALDDILEFVYGEMRPVIPYNRIGFSLIDETQNTVIARWARSDRDMFLSTGYEAPLEGSSLQEILRTGRPRIINDLEAYLAAKPHSDSTKLIVREGMRSSLTCPLIVRGRPVGFMFFSSVTRDAYSNVHVGFFQQVAGLLSGIVEKGRLYSELADQKAIIERQNKVLTEELEMARRVQRALIPGCPPTVRGLQIACEYEPAIQIGGDLLDIVPLEADRVLFFVGDAMGHGVQAALVMAVAKTALQSAVQLDPHPAKVLACVNRVIGRLNIEQFVTAACCLTHPPSGHTTLALAGHPWPIWFRGDAAEVEQPGHIGLPLGLEQDAQYDTVEMRLEAGDALVFYTDGVVDAFNSDKVQYGLERLREQVLKHGRRDARDILAAIRSDLDAHCGAHSRADDVALLAVKKLGVRSSFFISGL